MIGGAVRIHLRIAVAKASAAADGPTQGIATAHALEAQLAVHACMAIASPQALANNFYLPAGTFETVCRIAVDIEAAIGALSAHEMDLDHFCETMSAIAADLEDIASDKPAPRIEHSAYAAPQGTA